MFRNIGRNTHLQMHKKVCIMKTDNKIKKEEKKMNARKILKTITILIVFTMLSILISGGVYASSFKFNVSASKTKLKPGEETIITMKISDIVDSNNLGINAVESVLEYDKNIFEVITTSNMEGKNNWTITYNQQEQNFLVNNIISGVKEEQEIGQIKFKVKENVGKTTTKIKFKSVKSNDGTNLMNGVDREVEITIDWGNGNNTNTIQIPSYGNTASGKIPQTGEGNGIVTMLTILGIISVVSYISYRKIKLD